MTWYLTIRSDARYSRTTATHRLVEHLRTFPELVAVTQMGFRSNPCFPSVSIMLALADESGNYIIDGNISPIVNVVEMVCGDGGEDWYEALAGRVGSFLGWEAVEEHSGRIVYSPD